MDRSTARSLLYNMLSLGYVYPDEKVYASIAGGEWIRGVREALHILDEKILDEHLGAMEKTISGAQENEQPAMSREYTRLFTDVSTHLIASPYGSIHHEEKGLASAEMTSELLRYYHEVGFALKEDLNDLPDHIAHVLEFMGVLTAKESEASGNEKIKLEEIQMNFLSRIILPWVPTFCGNVAEHSRHPFYRYLANLTKEFINFEKNYLGVPEELNSPRENQSIPRINQSP
ncbi:MAG: TorD/DmsD family molecular chaperone [Thermodesulfobacteriota bacterium]